MSLQGLDRRTFQLSVIYGLGAVISVALAVPAAIYLLFPPRARKKAEWVDAGEITKLPLNVPEEVVFRRNRSQETREGYQSVRRIV